MSILANLKVLLTADTTTFRRAMEQSATLIDQTAGKIQGLAADMKTLQGRGGDSFRIPGGAGGGQFTGAAQAMEIYQSKIHALDSELKSLQRGLTMVNAPLREHPMLALLSRDAVAQATTATRSFTVATTELSSTINTTSTSLAAIQSSATSLVDVLSPRASAVLQSLQPLTLLQRTLSQLNLVNYDVTQSFRQWDTLQVLRGPGLLNEMMDTLKNTFLGMTMPMRRVQHFAEILSLTLMAISNQLTTLRNNPAAEELAEVLAVRAANLNPERFGSGLMVFIAHLRQSLVNLRPALTGGLSDIAKFGVGMAGISYRAMTSIIPPREVTDGLGLMGMAIQALRVPMAGIAAVAGGVSAAFAGVANVGMRVVGTLYAITIGAAKTLVVNALRGVFQGLGQAMFSAAVSTAKAAANLLTLGMFAEATKPKADRMAASMQRMSSLRMGLSMLSPHLSMIATLGLGAATVIGAMAGALKGMKFAADTEQISVAFKTMLGDADKAKQLNAEITAFSAATPFQIGDLRNAAKTLLGFNISQQQIVPTMRMLGDIASGTGKDLGELTAAYGKMRARGVADMEHLNTFFEAGALDADKFAAQLGVTKDALFKLVENKQVSFGDVQRGLIAATSAGGKFFGMIGAQGQTVKGLLSTLHDNVNIALGKIGEALFEAFNVPGAIRGLIGITQFIADTVVPGVIATLQPMIRFFSGVGSAIYGAIAPQFYLMGQAGRIVYAVLDLISGPVQMLIQSAAALHARSAVWSVLTSAVTAFGAGLFWLLSPLFTVTGAIGFLVATVVQMAGGWEATFTYLNSLVERVLGTSITGIFRWFADQAQTAFIMVEFAAMNWWSMMVLATTNAALGIVRFGNVAVYYLTEVIPKYLGWFIDNYQDIFQTLLNFTAAVLRNLWGNWVNFWKALMDMVYGNSAGFEFTWTPLTKGFENTIRQMPRILKREIGGIELELERSVKRQQDTLRRSWDDFSADRRQQLEKDKAAAGPAVAAAAVGIGAAAAAAAAANVNPDSGGTNKKGKKAKTNELKALEFGSAEAFKAGTGKQKDDKLLKETKNANKQRGRHLKLTEKIVTKLSEPGEVADFGGFV